MATTRATRAWRATAHGEAIRAAYERRPDVIRKKKDHNLRKRYGITLDEYETLLIEGCAICGRTTDLVVDHDHESGIVRGILCRFCNMGLGIWKDDAELLGKALAYLKGELKSASM